MVLVSVLCCKGVVELACPFHCMHNIVLPHVVNYMQLTTSKIDILRCYLLHVCYKLL